MPLSIALSAFFFNLINGVINGLYVRLYTADLDLNAYNVYIGLILFGLGMYINISSDNRLISLRKKSKGYKIINGDYSNIFLALIILEKLSNNLDMQ